MKERTHKTEAELLREALLVQNACNLSGVVHSFSRAMSDLWELKPDNEGTHWVNTHPVAVLYSDKIRQLSETDFKSIDDAFRTAWLANTELEELA